MAILRKVKRLLEKASNDAGLRAKEKLHDGRKKPAFGEENGLNFELSLNREADSRLNLREFASFPEYSAAFSRPVAVRISFHRFDRRAA